MEHRLDSYLRQMDKDVEAEAEAEQQDTANETEPSDGPDIDSIPF